LRGTSPPSQGMTSDAISSPARPPHEA
jgi:hypothetical protein